MDNQTYCFRAAMPFLEQVLEREGRKVQLDALRNRESPNITVVDGEFDYVEELLDLLQLRVSLVSPEQVENKDFRFKPETVFLNSTGKPLNQTGVDNVRSFVEEGGKLVSVDWAIETIEKAFPYTIQRHSDQTEREGLIAVDEPNTTFGKKLVSGESGLDMPYWWVKERAFPIEVVNPGVVVSHLESKELLKYCTCNSNCKDVQYLAVTFPWGKGAVLHFVNSFWAKRTDIRDETDKGTLEDFAGLVGATVPKNYLSRGISIAGLKTGYSLLNCLWEIVTSGLQVWREHPLQDKPSKLRITAEGYDSFNFNFAEEVVGGVTAVYDLSKRPITIGQGSQNCIDLKAPGITRKYATIVHNGISFAVQKLSGLSGFFINGNYAGEDAPFNPEKSSVLLSFGGPGTFLLEKYQP